MKNILMHDYSQAFNLDNNEEYRHYGTKPCSQIENILFLELQSLRHGGFHISSLYAFASCFFIFSRS